VIQNAALRDAQGKVAELVNVDMSTNKRDGGSWLCSSVIDELELEGNLSSWAILPPAIRGGSPPICG